jgi:anti-sigma factor RsiW
MAAAPDQVTAWDLERYRLGELPSVDAEAMRSALAATPTLREQVAELERSDEAILAACPPRAAAAAIRERLARAESANSPRRGIPRPALAGLAVLAVGLGVGVAVLGPGSRPSEVGVLEPDTTRVKGLRPQLLLFRQTPVGPEALEDGALARAHEVVQLSYQSAGQPYGVIVSVDGRGAVTVHLPAEGPQAARLKPGRPVALATAYRLDDAPTFERFHFVTSTRPFAVAVITGAVRNQPAGDAARVTHLPLPTGLQQSSFTLRKDVTR